MMFRWTNKQPEMQKKNWNWCSQYQEIYDWISPLNKRQSMGKMSMVIGDSRHKKLMSKTIFTLLKHLMMLLKSNFFSGLHFHTLSKTLIACKGSCSSDFQSGILLNNVFKAFRFQSILSHCLAESLYIFPCPKGHDWGTMKSNLPLAEGMVW